MTRGLRQRRRKPTKAMVELDSDQPNIRRAIALLDDSRNGIVDVVEGGLSGGCSKADLNQLDSARMYINKAISMLTKSSSPPEWMFSSVQPKSTIGETK